MVFITEFTIKGTDRSPQEYLSPLLGLTGQEYAMIPFYLLHDRICDALRGNRAPIMAEVFLPGKGHRIFRSRRNKGE